MKFQPGDKVTFICTAKGVIMNDPVNSFSSILVQFNGSLLRIPKDGTLAGGNVRLVKIEEDEPYERT